MKLYKAWRLLVVVTFCGAFFQGSLAASDVNLLDAATNYSKAIKAAATKTTFIDVYNAAGPLVFAAPVDLGAAVRDNWYRVPTTMLADIRDALTGVANRLLISYKTQDENFASLYDGNIAFQTALLSVNDSSRMPDTDTIWVNFISDETNKAFYQLLTALRRRRDFFKAAIDPTTLASSPIFSTEEITRPDSLINKLLTKPALPAGAPANGDLVIVKVNVNGAPQYMNAITTDDGIILQATGKDPLDPTAVFKFAVDFDIFGLQINVPGGKYLIAEDVVASAGWLPTKRQKVTRLALSGADFSSTSTIAGKFYLEPVSGMTGHFVVRSANYPSGEGYLKVDIAGDFSARVLDSGSNLSSDGTFTPYRSGDATPISFIKFTSFHKSLSDLRLIADAAQRLTRYTQLLDSTAISTLDDFLFLVAEAQMYVDANRSSAANWKVFSDGGGVSLAKTLIQKLRQNMVAQTASTSTIHAMQNNAISTLELAVNAGMSASSAGPSFPDGSPIKDALVIIVTGNGTMLTLGDGASVVSVQKDLVDQNAQFIAEIDSSGNVAFKSPVASNRYLQAGAVTTNVSGWLAQARADISRATCLRTTPGQAERFTLASQGSAVGVYSFKNVESQGFFYVGKDNILRSLDTSGSAATLAAYKVPSTVFSFVPVDGFIKKLSALRSESQDKVRFDAYVGLAEQILTSVHVDLLLQELDLFVGKAVKSKAQWASWQSTGLDKTILSWLPKGLSSYTEKTGYNAVLKKLTDGYVVDVSANDISGLTAGDIVVLQVADQPSSFLQVQSDGTVKVVSGDSYLLDSSTQVVVVKSQADGSIIGFQSPFLNNFVLRAPDIAVPSGSSVSDLLTDRLAGMSCAKFDGTFDAAGSFEMVPVRVPGKIAITIAAGSPFTLKRKDKDGSLKVSVDGLVRFFDESSTAAVLPPVPDVSATKLFYTVISSLQKKLTDIRQLSDDVAKVSAYRALTSAIITLGDLRLVLLELKNYIETPRVDANSYMSFKNVEMPFVQLLNQIATSFANSLTQFPADAKVPTIDELKALYSAQLVQNIPASFSKLSPADKITALEGMFPSVSTADKAAQFLTLFGLAMADRPMFTEALSVRMKSLYQSVLMNDYTKVNTQMAPGGSQKLLEFWGQQLAASIQFADVVALLQPLADRLKQTQPVSSIDDASKSLFVAYATRLTALLDSSVDEVRVAVGSTLDSAAYTYLYDRKNNLVPVSNLIKNYVKAQNSPASFSALLDVLDKDLKAISATSQSSAMDKFIADATIAVSQRVQGLEADVARLAKILDDALWNPQVLNQPAVAAGKQRYDAQLKNLVAAVNQPIPFAEIVQYLSVMLDKNNAFAESDVSYFVTKSTQLINQKAGQSDPAVIEAAIRVITRGSRFQVAAQRSALDQLIAQLANYKASLTGSSEETYIQKINNLKSKLSVLDTQAATRPLSDADIQGFFDALQLLVENKLEGTPSQIDNLVAWLTSSALSTSRLVFSKQDGMQLIQKIVSSLEIQVKIADRVANLQQMLKKHPQFVDAQLKMDFLEKATFLASIEARQQASAEKYDLKTTLGQILAFAKANQFATDSTPQTGAQNIDVIVAQLNAPLNQVLAGSSDQSVVARLTAKFSALSFATKVAELDRGSSEIVDSVTAAFFVSLINIAVADRINAKDADVLRLKNVIQAAARAPGIADDPSKQFLAKLDLATTKLGQQLLFSDYFNAASVMISAFPADASKITDDTRNMLVGYAQRMADNLVSSADQSARIAAVALLKKLAFNQLSDRSSEILKICDVIEAYVPSEQIGLRYTQAVSGVVQLGDKISNDTISDILTKLTDLVSRRAEGVATDYETLKKFIDKMVWHSIVQNEPGQVRLKALTALEATLNQPIPVTDLINLLAARLNNQSFAPDDVTFFMGKAQMLVDQRESIKDKAVLGMAQNLLNRAARFQMASKRADVQQLVSLLQSQEKTFNQKDYVSYSDAVAQIKNRLTDLDTKAQATTLSVDESKLFLKDLETLINNRAQGVAANSADLSSWLQSAVTQSRFFFVTGGAKDRAAALLLTLQKTVPYADHYNYLASLLRDYPNFSSTQMITDFFDKCAYLVSDDGKKQAISEGFDYKKLQELLVFAGQNQAATAKDEINALIAKLALPVAGMQQAAQPYKKKIVDLDAALSNLNDAGTNLSDYVAKLEDLVTNRFDAVDFNEETKLLNDLLQKVLWNAVLRGAGNANSLIARVQAAIGGLAKPILFTDLSAYLIAEAKKPLTLPEEQNRFITQVGNLVNLREQSSDVAVLDQIIAAVKLVAFNQLQKRSELSPLINQLQGYRDQLGKQTVESFNKQIEDLNARISGLDASKIDKFLSQLSGLVGGRFEASSDQLKALSDLVNQVSWLNIVRTNTQKGYPQLLAGLIKEVARVPVFQERIQDLNNMLSGKELLNDVLQDSFVQKAQQMLMVKSQATLSQLTSVVQLIQVAMFNQVKGRNQELQDILNTFVRQQQSLQATGGMLFGDRVRQLQQLLPSMSEQSLTDFKQQVSDLFANRVDAADEDIASFKNLLQAAAWNNVVVGLKNRGNSGPSDDFSNWYNTVDAPIDFSVWKSSLSAMLQADTLPPVLQQQFMRKVNKLVAAIPRATKADLQDAQALLLQASFNQLSRSKTELDVAINKLKTAADSQKGSGTTLFSDDIKALKEALKALTRGSIQDDVDAFVKKVTDLVDRRVDAIGDDISVLKAWMTSTEVQNNEGIYFRQGGESLVKLAATLDIPVPYAIRVQNLVSIIQNNEVFTDQQKTVVMAKIKLIVDLRAQGSAEGFNLADVVKVLQFLIERRMDKTSDGALIATLNNAIYTLQSGSSGKLRPRYAEQIVQAKAALASLTTADIPKFMVLVKTLVDGRADGTADQIGDVYSWLVSPDVQANKVLFFTPQKGQLQVLAKGLNTLPPYVDRYNNVRQLLQDYPVMDDPSIVQEFMAKALILVSQRGQAATEKFDLQMVKDLFVFALQNRLQNDSENSNKLTQYMAALDRPADQAVATGTGVAFAARMTEVQNFFKTITQSNLAEFVNKVSDLVASRIDATDDDIKSLKAWLESDQVENNRIVFLYGGVKQLAPLIKKLDDPITFAQRVDNLRVMIQNLAEFTADDAAIFLAKVDKLIAERWRASQESFDIEDVVSLLEFVQVNQLAKKELQNQMNMIPSKITALRTAADGQGPAVKYATYQERIEKVQAQFLLIGSTQKDIAAMNQLAKDIDQLVVDRVDGSDVDRASLITFISSRILYHQLVYNTPLEEAFKKNISGLMAPVTYGELYANFKKLLTVGVYSAEHKNIFKAKLKVLIDGRAGASSANVDLNQLSRDVTFAKINKFGQEMLDDRQRTAPDRNPTIKEIEDMVAQLSVAPVTTLAGVIAKVYTMINVMTPENWSTASADQRTPILAQLRIISNNVDETTSMNDKTSIDDLFATAKVRVFRNDQTAKDQIDEYRKRVASFGGLS